MRLGGTPFGMLSILPTLPVSRCITRSPTLADISGRERISRRKPEAPNGRGGRGAGGFGGCGGGRLPGGHTSPNIAAKKSSSCVVQVSQSGGSRQTLRFNNSLNSGCRMRTEFRRARGSMPGPPASRSVSGWVRTLKPAERRASRAGSCASPPTGALRLEGVSAEGSTPPPLAASRGLRSASAPRPSRAIAAAGGADVASTGISTPGHVCTPPEALWERALEVSSV
mmetsp:Transcript_31249/g.91131  ORF Transcript_31249/g.91131 Transcript_31249/m.91131 type:complete len:226 (+) Transcript_31249:311-988(+)